MFPGPFETFRSPTKEAFVGGPLEKHLLLRRTLLLRLQGYQTYADAGMLAPGLANAVLVQHLVSGDVCGSCFPISVAY